MAVEQTPDGAWRHTQTMPLPDMVGQFGERHVGVLGQGQKLIGVGFKTNGPMIAVEGATLKSFAAERRDIPPSTADISRSRKSIERAFAMQAGLLHQPAS